MTAYSQNLREYASSNQNSGTLETFYDISCKGRAILGAEEEQDLIITLRLLSIIQILGF